MNAVFVDANPTACGNLFIGFARCRIRLGPGPTCFETGKRPSGVLILLGSLIVFVVLRHSARPYQPSRVNVTRDDHNGAQFLRSDSFSMADPSFHLHFTFIATNLVAFGLT